MRTTPTQQNKLFSWLHPIPVQEIFHLKAIEKNHPNGRLYVGNHRSKTLSENLGGFIPRSPPGSAYEKTHFAPATGLSRRTGPARNVSTQGYLRASRKQRLSTKWGLLAQQNETPRHSFLW